ncbi:hypothetical protein GCK32_019187 [Trichostrongylus colubriformis]|uniref:Uncharacterized protein n=1 Tax=Trichostrongylus colubriformis TaxID=6319 RepID=A0AAN8FT30_TRICO
MQITVIYDTMKEGIYRMQPLRPRLPLISLISDITIFPSDKSNLQLLLDTPSSMVRWGHIQNVVNNHSLIFFLATVFSCVFGLLNLLFAFYNLYLLVTMVILH